MYDLLEEVLDTRLVVVGLFFLGGFGMGPGSDVSRTSPSRGEEKFSLLVGTADVRLGLVPHFALGPIADVSSPASSSGDSLVLGVNDVDRWFDVGGVEVRDVGVTSPSYRVSSSVIRYTFGAVSGQYSVSTPSSFLAFTVFRPTRGR